MKFKLILGAVIMCSLQAFSQSNSISIVGGYSIANVDIHGALGDFGYNTKTAVATGLIYTKEIKDFFSLQTGLFFSDDKVEFSSILPGRAGINIDGDLKIISIPITAKFTFFKFAFADAGLSFDKEINYTGNYVQTDQSGIGVELGFGGQYAFKHFTVFVNPYLKVYGTTHFNSYEDFNLIEGGYKFGLGYNF